MMTTAAPTLERENLDVPKSEAGPLAEIRSVPRSDAGKVLSGCNIWISVGLTLLPIPVGLASLIGGIAAGVILGGANPALAGACVVAGIAGAVGSVIVLLQFQHFLPSRYFRSVARRAFAGRKDPLVRFEDADAEFVDIVPRSNWGRTMLEPATDIGLLRIDHDRRELLFEGDSKCYRIPFAAVRECEVEAIRLDADDWGNDLYFATVLTFETATGTREMPLAGRHLTFRKRRMPQREEQAEQLCARILTALNA